MTAMMLETRRILHFVREGVEFSDALLRQVVNKEQKLESSVRREHILDFVRTAPAARADEDLRRHGAVSADAGSQS